MVGCWLFVVGCWLVGWLVGWWVGWLVGWLVGYWGGVGTTLGLRSGPGVLRCLHIQLASVSAPEPTNRRGKDNAIKNNEKKFGKKKENKRIRKIRKISE